MVVMVAAAEEGLGRLALMGGPEATAAVVAVLGSVLAALGLCGCGGI
jgi:hypothetical protein